MPYGFKLPGTDIVKVPASPGGGGATNLAATLSATNTIITSSSGNDATIPAADTTNAGVMTKAMFDKLAGIEDAADVTDLTNVGTALVSASAKATIVDADKFTILDSAALFAPKTSLWSLIKSTLKTYFDGFYATLAQANATHTGDATGATALTLATVNSNVGSFTNANVTVNAKGLVTAVSNGSSGGTISTPKVYYVETTGSNVTGAVGNPALPYLTFGAAYNAGVTAAVNFCVVLGVGSFSLTLTADISPYLKQVFGKGRDLTILSFDGTPIAAEAGAAGYAVTLNVVDLNLTLNLPGGQATGVTMEAGGSANLQTITGSNCFLTAYLQGGLAADGNGGSGGTLRCNGSFKCIDLDVTGGAGGPSGISGQNGGLEMDGCDLCGCNYGSTPSISNFARCSYSNASITPTGNIGGNAAY